MKLLILLFAMGVIGVIGTVEYSHAQTILTIPEPDNFPDTTRRSIILEANTTTNVWLRTFNETISNSQEPYIANIYFPIDTLFGTHQLFKDIKEKVECTVEIRSVKRLISDYPNAVPNLIVPSNIPDNKTTIHAIGFDFYNITNADENRETTCTPNPETTSKKPLLTDKPLRFTIYGKHDKKAYYFSPRDNITQAQTIPLCTTENFDTTTQLLKSNAKMCYGKNGNDMVIITKRITGFYGATESITTPTKPIALDSDYNDTLDYYNLLKKLYLPAI